MRGLKSAVTGVVGKVKNAVIGPDILKTVDAEYTAAEAKFKGMECEGEQVLGYIIQMDQRLQKLSRHTTVMSEHLTSWFIDAPDDIRIRAQTTDSFTRSFDNYTTNFLGPRMEKYVIEPLSSWHQAIVRIRRLREERKEAREGFDKHRANVSALDAEKKPNASTLSRETERMDHYQGKYRQLNAEFIRSVSGLPELKGETLDLAFKNLGAIMSQYTTLVFTDLQKFRTTFPPELFGTQASGVNPFKDC